MQAAEDFASGEAVHHRLEWLEQRRAHRAAGIVHGVAWNAGPCYRNMISRFAPMAADGRGRDASLATPWRCALRVSERASHLWGGSAGACIAFAEVDG